MEKETLARFLAASSTYLGSGRPDPWQPAAHARTTMGGDRLPVYTAVYPLSTMGVEQ